MTCSVHRPASGISNGFGQEPCGDRRAWHEACPIRVPQPARPRMVMMMSRTLSTLTLATMVAAGACSRGGNKPADSALNTDLSLAAQQRAYTPLDSVSAAERA